MKKKFLGIATLCFLMGATMLPVHAGNSYLNIKANDIYSLKENKDDGEDNFYVHPSTYSGTYVRVRSRCLANGAYTSGYQQVYKGYSSKAYSYGRDVVGGYLYQLDGYGAPGNTWHLVGTWCP